jgi:glycosyltransferase involved in cell wall biosynthesis
MDPLPVITYVEFGSTGHRPIWIRAVVEAFLRKPGAARLSVWVPSDFQQRHEDWCGQFYGSCGCPGKAVRFQSYEGSCGVSGDPKDPAYADFKTPKEVFEITRRCLAADHASVGFLANNLDLCLKSIALARPGKLRARLLGVMDLPFLHYRQFSVRQNAEWLPRKLYWKLWVRNLLASQRLMLRRIFMMDPYAPDYYNRVLRSRKYQFLPEAFMTSQPFPNGRQHFGLPEDRLILLSIGPTAARKGIRELLWAVEEMWSASPALRRQVALVVAGLVLADSRPTVYSAFERMRAAYPEAGLFLFDRLLSDREFVTFVDAADVICIPYVRFVGTSGVLVHAAQAGRPVLGPEFGVLGELVRRHKLGVTCNTARADAVLEGVNRSLELARRMDAGRRDEIKNFVRNNTISVTEFGQRIADAITAAAYS